MAIRNAEEQKKEIAEQEVEPISFSAGLSTNFTKNEQNHGIVVYDTLQLLSNSNTDFGYNNKNGIFIATEPGKYIVYIYTCLFFDNTFRKFPSKAGRSTKNRHINNRNKNKTPKKRQKQASKTASGILKKILTNLKNLKKSPENIINPIFLKNESTTIIENPIFSYIFYIIFIYK